MTDATTAGLNAAASSASHARRRVALATTSAGILTVLATCVWAWSHAWEPARALALARGTGWLAFGMLLLSLLVTPLGRVGARFGGRVSLSQLALVRRALGMCAAWLALGHALCSLTVSLDGNWTAVWSWPHLRSGVTALLVLLVLLATSFAAVVAALRVRYWRELHRLAYVAPLLVLQHVLLSPFAPRVLTLSLVAAVYVLGLARFLPARARRPTPDAKRDEPV